MQGCIYRKGSYINGECLYRTKIPRPIISGERVGAAPPAAAAPPVQLATLLPATADVAVMSPNGGQRRRGTVAKSPPPSHRPCRQPRRRPARRVRRPRGATGDAHRSRAGGGGVPHPRPRSAADARAAAPVFGHPSLPSGVGAATPLSAVSGHPDQLGERTETRPRRWWSCACAPFGPLPARGPRWMATATLRAPRIVLLTGSDGETWPRRARGGVCA